MPCFRRNIRPHRVTICLLLLASAGLVGWTGRQENSRPLAHAHAHNDYWHERPLIDALDRGFCSIEVDVFLDGHLLAVGHARSELKPSRTLEALYLEPLQKRIAANRGRVYAGGPTVYLLIDVKSEAEPTYAAIDSLLARYADMLSTFRDDSFEQKAVTVVISGNRDERMIRHQQTRFAGIDGRSGDLDSTDPSHVMPWISENWNTLFRWQGEGAMPVDERTRLRNYVREAHAKDRLVRFWATPENESVWQELLAAEVDLIGTDDLDRLRRFLIRARTAGE